MFSNSISYALEETVKEFNIFLNERATVKHTATDLKNAFYQRLRKNLLGTNQWNHVAYSFGIDNVTLNVERGNLVGLNFNVTSRYNHVNESFITECQEAMKSIDLIKLASECDVYKGVAERFSSAIVQINNFKVKKLVWKTQQSTKKVMEKAVVEKKKEFNKEMEACFQLVENIEQLKAEYSKAFESMSSGKGA